MLPPVSLVLGGAASGKSAFAEDLVIGLARPCVYVATARVQDAEMREKVARHQRQRGNGWRTVEEPFDAGGVLSGAARDEAILVDCATMWLSNHVLAGTDLADAETAFFSGIAACPAPVVIVSNEVGLSVVPENALARRFREVQGRLNQSLAREADLVVNVVAGLPQVLKGALP